MFWNIIRVSWAKASFYEILGPQYKTLAPYVEEGHRVGLDTIFLIDTCYTPVLVYLHTSIIIYLLPITLKTRFLVSNPVPHFNNFFYNTIKIIDIISMLIFHYDTTILYFSISFMVFGVKLVSISHTTRICANYIV